MRLMIHIAIIPLEIHGLQGSHWLIDFLPYFSFATYFASSGISGVDYWLPYDLARYAPDVIPLQCNGPNTTWDHEASPDSAVCYRTHELRDDSFDLIILCCRRQTWTCGRRGPYSRWNSSFLLFPSHIPHLSPSQSLLLHRCRPTKFKSERTPRASKWSMAPAPSSLRATSTSLGAGWSEQCNHNWDELSCN